MAKINYLERLNDLVGVFNGQKKVAQSLGLTQPTVSRYLKGSRRLNPKLHILINRRWNYYNKKYLFQPQAQAKVDAYTFPIWVSGEVVELENLGKSYQMLEERLAIKYKTVEIIKFRTRKFKEDNLTGKWVVVK